MTTEEIKARCIRGVRSGISPLRGTAMNWFGAGYCLAQAALDREVSAWVIAALIAGGVLNAGVAMLRAHSDEGWIKLWEMCDE